MKKRTEVVGLGVISVALAAGLIVAKPKTPEPGIPTVQKVERSWSIPAEDSEIYQNAKISMREWCDEEGLRSEVWIERNKTGRLEVLGRCLGRQSR